MYYIVSYNTLHKTNNFPMAKIEAILLLIKPISKEKSLFTDAPDRKNPTSSDKEMSDRSKVAKMPEVKHIISESKHITST